MIFFGNGSDKCTDDNPSQCFFINGIYPTASHLGIMAFEKFKRNEVEDLVNFEPHYLKEFMIKNPNRSIE